MDSHVSASQLSTWLRCQRQYEFRYMHELIMPPKSAMTRGSAFHKAIETDHKYKAVTRENLATEAVLDAYSDEFDRLSPETKWDPEDNQGAIKDCGVWMTELYHNEVSTKIQPLTVESEFNIEIGGHEVKGFIDLETEDGSIREAKSTGSRSFIGKIDHLLQLSVYSSARPDAKKFYLDNAMVSPTGKSRELITLTYLRGELPLSRLHAYLDAFSSSLKTGTFYSADPNSFACSEKACGYWNICKFGGGNK